MLVILRIVLVVDPATCKLAVIVPAVVDTVLMLPPGPNTTPVGLGEAAVAGGTNANEPEPVSV